jgi:hypothetical protein
MPGWTQDDVDRRNRAVFGEPEPTELSALPDENAKDIPEQQIALECEQLLHEDGWRTIRCEPLRVRSRGRGFGEIGMADLLALRYGKQKAACEVLWLEWKAPGGRVRKHQIEWHTKERARGAVTAIAGVDFRASVAGFVDWYHANGLARRRDSAWTGTR